MKKKIEIKQEEMKDIDFSKIKNCNYVNVDAKENLMIIEFEMKDGEKNN